MEKNNPFVFLICKGWRGTNWDRGGVQYALQAFSEEFSKDENVELLLKLNPSYINPQLIQQCLDKLNLPKNRPEIKINIDNIPYKNLSEFYNQGDIIVSPTRAEAFNLPLIEGMAVGLPVITTNYGGQTDFVNNKNGWLINYKLEPVKEDVMYEEVQWAVPDIEHLKKTMRLAFINKEKTKEKGKQAIKDVRNWKWRKSAQQAMKFLRELE